MLENDLLPSSCKTIEMIGLLGLRGIVKRLFQPTVFGATVTPLVTASLMVELIEESDLRGGERIPVVLIAFHLFMK